MRRPQQEAQTARPLQLKGKSFSSPHHAGSQSHGGRRGEPLVLAWTYRRAAAKVRAKPDNVFRLCSGFPFEAPRRRFFRIEEVDAAQKNRTLLSPSIPS
jgi:hypothetical protein